jgi:hypothetical protein
VVVDQQSQRFERDRSNSAAASGALQLVLGVEYHSSGSGAAADSYPDFTINMTPEKSGYRQVRLWPKIWLKTNLVVHGRNEPLTRAEIALRGFDRSVTEQELDLLQFSSSSMAQAGTRTAQVMRG